MWHTTVGVEPQGKGYGKCCSLEDMGFSEDVTVEINIFFVVLILSLYSFFDREIV